MFECLVIRRILECDTNALSYKSKMTTTFYRIEFKSKVSIKIEISTFFCSAFSAFTSDIGESIIFIYDIFLREEKDAKQSYTDFLSEQATFRQDYFLTFLPTFCSLVLIGRFCRGENRSS